MNDLLMRSARILGWVALLAVLPRAVNAQILELGVQLTHGVYVLGESIDAKVRVINRGAQPLVIDDHEAFRDNRLVFEITTANNEAVETRRQERMVSEMDLNLNEAFETEVDLGAWYSINKPGRYFVTAVLFHNDRRYVSDRRAFDVVPGLELASLTTILPGSPAVERQFTLVYWTREGADWGFVRIEDKTTGTRWQTIPLGKILRVTPPRLVAEEVDLVTVTHQSTRDIFMVSGIRSTAAGPVLLKQAKKLDETAMPLANALGDLVDLKRATDKNAGGGKAKDKPDK